MRVEPQFNFPMQPLHSIAITATSTLLRVAPPQCLASVFPPCGFGHLDFSLRIEATGSRSSFGKPRPDSRDLYTGHHPHSHQASCGLILQISHACSFDVTNGFSMRHQPFICIRLSDPYLPGLFPDFSSTLTTTPLKSSRLRWFEAYS